MEQKKRNRREEYTLRVIRETFLELLSKQRVECISIGALCAQADINRSTFYRHYADVYALLDELCEECFQNLFGNLARFSSTAATPERTAYELILQACTVTEENKELYQILVFKQPAARFHQRMSDAFFQLFLDHHDVLHSRTPETNLHYQYLASGILGIWQAWLKDDCQLPKTVVAEIVEIHLGGVSQVIWDRHSPALSARVNFQK